MSDPLPSDRSKVDVRERLPRYLVEMVVGLALAALLVLALVASVGSVPFIYQGF